MTHLQLRNITKRFGSIVAVDSVSLELAAGEIVCLLGPSGCGKTTLLRLVAGLENADAGNIYLGDRDLATIPTYQRGIGMMFQSYALFPHMNVADNIGYGLKMQNAPQTTIDERVNEMLALVALDGLGKRRIDQLSGGQQQRVALARSLATQPSVLLLDEPLGSLDRLLRERLLIELRAILKKVGVTALYVTHDQSEAFGIADRVAVMNKGRIEQIAAPQMLFMRPANAFVASFLGLNNVVTINHSVKTTLTTALQTWLQQHKETLPAQILIPPYAAVVGGDDRPNHIPLTAIVISYTFRGRFALLQCKVEGQRLEFSLDPFVLAAPPSPKIDDLITLQLNPAHFVVLNGKA